MGQLEEILLHRRAVESNIEKSFSDGFSMNDELEKARSGVYSDNAQNRKLNRVGQEYGKAAQPKEKSVSYQKMASQASDGALKRAAADKNADPKVRDIAKKELDKRDGKESYSYHPKTKAELKDIIKKEIFQIQGERNNPKWDADLNMIDISQITDMSHLFEKSKFNGDISKWNVSNVKDMNGMFYRSKFNGDVSKWDVSNVEDMRHIFERSKFNGDISKWNVSNVKDVYI